mmetsp:Transcript_43538/g.138636  ORF Transcript_43538/g.138636 Transcript_43538/m.138636 type:complete len:212 (-) Transcript_43538:123-758(-)
MGAAWSEHGADRRWFHAVERGDRDELKRLMGHNADPSARDCRGLTSLMITAAKGHEACLALLVHLGATLDDSDGQGWTAVTHAAVHGKDRCLKLLAEFGASLDAKDFLGTTAVMRAAISGHERCLRMLVDHGADLQARDNLGMDALAHARRKGRTSCVHILEDRCASALPKALLLSQSRRRVLQKEHESFLRQSCKATLLCEGTACSAIAA